MLEIEKSFGSNVCRCTGYRPILEAFKKFAKDAPKPKLPDIEDLQICSKTGKACASNSDCDSDDWCFISNNDVKNSVLQINLKDGKKWLKVNFIFEIFNILHVEGLNSYMLVQGNTAKGMRMVLTLLNRKG